MQPKKALKNIFVFPGIGKRKDKRQKLDINTIFISKDINCRVGTPLRPVIMALISIALFNRV